MWYRRGSQSPQIGADVITLKLGRNTRGKLPGSQSPQIGADVITGGACCYTLEVWECESQSPQIGADVITLPLSI